MISLNKGYWESRDKKINNLNYILKGEIGLKNVVVVGGVRTPFGKMGGGLGVSTLFEKI